MGEDSDLIPEDVMVTAIAVSQAGAKAALAAAMALHSSVTGADIPKWTRTDALVAANAMFIHTHLAWLEKHPAQKEMHETMMAEFAADAAEAGVPAGETVQ